MSSISPKIPDMVLCIVSIMVRMASMVAIIGGNCSSSCGSSASSLTEVFDEIVQLIANLIDTVD